MRTGFVLLGSFLLALLLVPTPAQAQWCQGIDGPYWCGDPDACEAICTEPWADCTTSCSGWGGWTTCGGGGPDTDGDGVNDDVDNCGCAPNSNQADCDGDGAGNVCDGENANYVFSHADLCMVDRDTHFGYFELEKHFDWVYTDSSSCGAPPTYDTHEDPNSAWCFNISTHDCCLYVLEAGDWWCDRVDQDFCQGN